MLIGITLATLIVGVISFIIGMCIGKYEQEHINREPNPYHESLYFESRGHKNGPRKNRRK